MVDALSYIDNTAKKEETTFNNFKKIRDDIDAVMDKTNSYLSDRQPGLEPLANEVLAKLSTLAMSNVTAGVSSQRRFSDMEGATKSCKELNDNIKSLLQSTSPDHQKLVKQALEEMREQFNEKREVKIKDLQRVHTKYKTAIGHFQNIEGLSRSESLSGKHKALANTALEEMKVEVGKGFEIDTERLEQIHDDCVKLIPSSSGEASHNIDENSH